MFVTSDILDLERIARVRRQRWTEYLLCGVAVHGPRWPGAQAAAKFLVGAADMSGLAGMMEYASYSRLEDRRPERYITPASVGRIARGEKRPDASTAISVLLRAAWPKPYDEVSAIIAGGVVSGGTQTDPGPLGRPRPVTADFLCPLSHWSPELGRDLLKLAVGLLDCEYGYSFVRDALVCPSGYAFGGNGMLVRDEAVAAEAEEIWNWYKYAGDGLWERSPPVFRDLFAINLIPKAYATAEIRGLGRLTDWISASPARGRLEDAGRGRLLWTLSDAEIATVRPVLNTAGLLFSCRPRVYRDLPGHHDEGARSGACGGGWTSADADLWPII